MTETGDHDTIAVEPQQHGWLTRGRLFFENRIKRRRTVTFLEASAIGITSAPAAIVFGLGVGALHDLRKHWCETLDPRLVMPVMGLVGGLLAGCLLKYVAPETTGSGIPQVKAILNDIPLPLNFKTAIAKLIGGTIALGVGLPLGREGPTVQIGAATAAIISKLGLSALKNRRQIIAAGAAAGLAAAFNAPLAGVIFVIEELLREVSSLTVSVALFACFFAVIVSRWMGNHSLDLKSSSEFPPAFFYGHSIITCLVLGVVCGLLAVVFNAAVLKVCKWNEKKFQKNFVVRVALAGLVCGLVLGFMPAQLRDVSGVRHLLLEGQGVDFAIAGLLANFCLTIVAYGSGAPGGLFAPSLTIGAAIGYLIGTGECAWFTMDNHAPFTIGLAGMGAFFAGVARVPITATVIVFEMTTDFNLLLPLMISTITAYLVGERLAPGSIYDKLLELQGIHLPSGAEESQHALQVIKVNRIMQSNVETIPLNATLGDVRELFKSSKHGGFPVIKDGILEGMVTRLDMLDKMTTNDDKALVSSFMAEDPVTLEAEETLADAVSLMEMYKLYRIPIVDKDKRLIGLVTRADVIKALASI